MKSRLVDETKWTVLSLLFLRFWFEHLILDPRGKVTGTFEKRVPGVSNRLRTVWRNQTCWISCTPDYRGYAEELLGEWVQVLTSAMISGVVGMDKHTLILWSILEFQKSMQYRKQYTFFLCLFCMDHLQCMAVNFFFITKEETIHLLKQLLFSLRDSQIYPESLR